MKYFSETSPMDDDKEMDDEPAGCQTPARAAELHSPLLDMATPGLSGKLSKTC